MLPTTRQPRWKISFKARSASRRNAQMVYALLERKLDRFLASQSGGKTSVKVIYDQRLDYTNETLKSTDKNYLLRTTADFLEDHLSQGLRERKQQQYAY